MNTLSNDTSIILRCCASPLCFSLLFLHNIFSVLELRVLNYAAIQIWLFQEKHFSGKNAPGASACAKLVYFLLLYVKTWSANFDAVCLLCDKAKLMG